MGRIITYSDLHYRNPRMFKQEETRMGVPLEPDCPKPRVGGAAVDEEREEKIMVVEPYNPTKHIVERVFGAITLVALLWFVPTVIPIVDRASYTRLTVDYFRQKLAPTTQSTTVLAREGSSWTITDAELKHATRLVYGEGDKFFASIKEVDGKVVISNEE